MSTLEAFVLGAVQGLGEFLPISSSGHLVVVPWLLGWAPHGLSFDVALHLGTLAAVLYAFAGDWWRIARGTLAGLQRGNPLAEPEGRLLARLAAASVPGAVAGLLLDEWAETTFRSPALVAVTMAVLGLVLFVADRRAGSRPEPFSTRDALLVGCAQALALLPGVSRSGATISMALLLGYRREESARFSFLLATPITFGAALLKVPELVQAGGLETSVLVGMASAALFGFLSIRVLLAYVRTRDYRPFVYYRWLFSLVVVAALLARR